MTKIWTVALSIFIVGCAAQKTREIEYHFDRSEGLFVPAQMQINRQVPVPRFYVSRINAIEWEFKNVGAFFNIGSYVNSPYVLDVVLHRGTHDNAGDTAGQLLSAATLFLIPSKVKNFHRFTVDFYAHGELVKSYEYLEDYEDTISAYDWKETNEFRSIRNLVRRFVEELDRDGEFPKTVVDNAANEEKMVI